MVEVASAFPSYSRGCRIERYRGARTGGTAETFHQHGWAQVHGFLQNQKHTFSTYASAQHIVRNSYYSAYGMTTDFTGVLGAQYIYHFDKCLFMPADLTGGIEFNHDNLHDKATDVQKYRDAALAEDPTATGDRLQQLIEKYTPAPLNQVVNIASVYAQNEWKNEQWSFLIGGRVDKTASWTRLFSVPVPISVTILLRM